MPNDCYRIPTSFGALMKREQVEKQPELDSIEQHIALYLGTKPGEYHYDLTYGCILHKFTFTQLKEESDLGDLKRSIEKYLKDFDSRIELRNVTLKVQDVLEAPTADKQIRSSRQIKISIRCRVKQTNEDLPEMKFDIVRYS